MAEADPLQRIKSAAERSQGPISVETQRQRHFATLDLELGIDPESKRRREQAARPSRLPSVTRIITYLMLFTLFLIVAMAIRLWHDGSFDRFIAANVPKVQSETGWMLSRGAAVLTDNTSAIEGQDNAAVPLPSFVEPLPSPPAPPQADAPEESDGGAAEEEG